MNLHVWEIKDSKCYVPRLLPFIIFKIHGVQKNFLLFFFAMNVLPNKFILEDILEMLRSPRAIITFVFLIFINNFVFHEIILSFMTTRRRSTWFLSFFISFMPIKLSISIAREREAYKHIWRVNNNLQRELNYGRVNRKMKKRRKRTIVDWWLVHDNNWRLKITSNCRQWMPINSGFFFFANLL